MGGHIFFQEDFGERRTFANTIQTVGFSRSRVYFLSLKVNRSSFARNLKVRFEVTAMAIILEHFGKYADADSKTGRQLRAMRSDIKMRSMVFNLSFILGRTMTIVMLREVLILQQARALIIVRPKLIPFKETLTI
jgi:hypothetical protein